MIHPIVFLQAGTGARASSPLLLDATEKSGLEARAPALMAGSEPAIARRMADEPESAVLQLLRRIDAKLDLLREEVRDLSECVARCAERLGAIELRLGRIELRLERIDQRLDCCFPGT